MKLLQLVACSLASFFCSVQNSYGQNLGLKSYKNETAKEERTLNYLPEGNKFVCVNGQNRFTRALYGGYTEFRVETSDRPVFAIFKKGHHRNIRFFVHTPNGQSLQLDKTDYCKASYEDGIRSYIVKDKQWGSNAYIEITVIASSDDEDGIWKFRTQGFEKEPMLEARVCNIAARKLSRNGDIGADKPGCFEPSEDEGNLKTKQWSAKGTTYFVMHQSDIVDKIDVAQVFESNIKRNHDLASRIVFSTPDPYINTLGGALVMAADGDWDGQTWLHGCIGWRIPLAGWRAGYLGDVLGWNDRAISHFDAYAKSQVTTVPPTIPHPTQDVKMNLARSDKKWGTQMYSNGYICRYPGKNDNMHHYDMNLNYIDELLWHFCYDADTAYMRKMWPVLKSHLAWEKRNFDPDNDGLYDGYCCIWASDALYYNGGAVTHSSAYNYRGNLLAARIAEIIGEPSAPYKEEAARILQAMNQRLWLADKGYWAEYQDLMGLKRKHESAAVWSVYTPIDCGAGTPQQFYQATRYVDKQIPHITVEANGKQYGSTISTTNWLPYSWSINNVAPAEVMHTALAYFEAGRQEAAFSLMKANLMDQMYLGVSPANFGQLSFYDAARGECYRDFGDVIGISARTLLQGLFGIVPDALNGQCFVRPGFPSSWDSASVTTPYLSYKFERKGGKLQYDITQNFTHPLKIVVRVNIGNGQYRDILGTTDKHQIITVDIPAMLIEPAEPVCRQTVDAKMYGLGEPVLQGGKTEKVNMSKYFNANVSDIFKNKYLSPRPPYTTLQIPVQGVGEWCHPQYTPIINDSCFRAMAIGNGFTVAGVTFNTPQLGHNVAYTSLWDNYPNSITVPLKGKASCASLLMVGSTNHMQCRIDNGLVVAVYADNTADTLRLVNPDNWCPVEQDYYIDGKAFSTTLPRPYRVCLMTGTVSRDLGKALNITGVYGREIPGGAAQLLTMPLNPKKKLRSLTVCTLSNDVVIGLMGITLQR